MKYKLSIVLLLILLSWCYSHNEVDKKVNIEDSSIKKSWNVLYCDELENWSLEQCEIRSELLK